MLQNFVFLYFIEDFCVEFQKRVWSTVFLSYSLHCDISLRPTSQNEFFPFIRVKEETLAKHISSLNIS